VLLGFGERARGHAREAEGGPGCREFWTLLQGGAIAGRCRAQLAGVMRVDAALETVICLALVPVVSQVVRHAT
jgi:hypothetical protein